MAVGIFTGLQRVLPTSRLFIRSRTDSDRSEMSYLLPSEGYGPARHCLLCATQKAESGELSPRLPPYWNGYANLERSEMVPGRTRCVHGFPQQLRSRGNVLLLLPHLGQSQVQRQCLVEKTHHPVTDRKILVVVDNGSIFY